MGQMKKLFTEIREQLHEHLPVTPEGIIVEFLEVLEEKGYWVQVSPLARSKPSEWIAAVYIKGKTSWVTEECKSGFETPKDAYDWGFEFCLNKNYHEIKGKEIS